MKSSRSKYSKLSIENPKNTATHNFDFSPLFRKNEDNSFLPSTNPKHRHHKDSSSFGGTEDDSKATKLEHNIDFLNNDIELVNNEIE